MRIATSLAEGDQAKKSDIRAFARLLSVKRLPPGATRRQAVEIIKEVLGGMDRLVPREQAKPHLTQVRDRLFAALSASCARAIWMNQTAEYLPPPFVSNILGTPFALGHPQIEDRQAEHQIEAIVTSLIDDKQEVADEYASVAQEALGRELDLIEISEVCVIEQVLLLESPASYSKRHPGLLKQAWHGFLKILRWDNRNPNLPVAQYAGLSNPKVSLQDAFVKMHSQVFLYSWAKLPANLYPERPTSDLAAGRWLFGYSEYTFPSDATFGRSDGRVVRNEITIRSERQFSSDLRSRLAECRSQKRPVLVFVHGFNNRFERALDVAARLTNELNPSAMVLFSWPVQGGISKYIVDHNHALASGKSLSKLLRILRQICDDVPLIVLAHSMGNQVVVESLSRCDVPIEGLLLCAPDVFADYFDDLWPSIRPYVQQTNLYCSANDAALKASKQVNGVSRLGLLPPPRTFEGITTIDVSDINIDGFGHSYLECPIFVSELKQIVSGLWTPPESRARVAPMIRTSAGVIIYKLRH